MLNCIGLIPGSRLTRCSPKTGPQKADTAMHAERANQAYLKLDNETGQKEDGEPSRTLFFITIKCSIHYSGAGFPPRDAKKSEVILYPNCS